MIIDNFVIHKVNVVRETIKVTGEILSSVLFI